MKKRLVLLSLTLFSVFLMSCGGGSNNPGGGEKPGPDVEPSKKDFVDVKFENESFIYDGKPHILNEVVGAPSDTTITYTNRNEYTDVGTYEASAKLTKTGYNDKILNATLTITPATFSGYTFESKVITYDGLDHINDIQLVGIMPEGTTANVTVKNSNNEIVNSVIEVGVYDFSCSLLNKNYNSITLNATLTIKPKKKEMPVFASDNGTTYFANGLHNDYLYSYNNGETKLIDYSVPKEFSQYDNTNPLFITGGTLLNSVKQINGEQTNSLYTDSSIDDFVKYNENIFYYSSNALRSNKSGIYKVDATNSNDEPIVTKIFEGKTDNLAINNNELYFINESNKSYLYKINLSNNQVTKIIEEKMHEFIINDNKLYCTINGLLNDYIGYIDLTKSNKEVIKLTNASGEYLSIYNNYLYYNYTDLYSTVDESSKGIWRINKSGGKAEQLLANSGVNGFDIQSNNTLMYVDSLDLHLYSYDLVNKNKVDLLYGFVAPESTPLNTGGRTISIGTKTYYLNMYAGKSLYVYDESSQKTSQLTINKVEDFYIYNDIMYFNQVTLFTNNDLYAVNIKMGGEAYKISSNDIRKLTCDGTYLYGTHYNFAGVSGGIARMKLDGSEYIKFSDVNGAKNLTIKDNKLYYINCGTGQDNGNIEYILLKDISSTSTKLTGTRLSKDIKNVKQFIFEDNNIYYIYNGTIDNSIRRTDFTSLNEGVKLASSKTNPNEMILKDDYIYYYSYAASAVSSAGFYKVNKNATSDGTQELIVGYDSKYYGSNLSISSDNKLYFLNYIPKLLLGDAHFYQIKLDTKVVLKIS